MFDDKEYAVFCGRVGGLERALWEWSRGRPESRFIHPSLGHEAAAWATTRALRDRDWLWSLYYRSHAWLLGLGVSVREIAEAVGGQCGSVQHRAGPMHLLLDPRVIDCNSIVGAQVPIAVGAAMAAADLGRGVVCVLGDGATNTGVFYESLNIATLSRAPVILVIEDNGVAMSTHYLSTSCADIEAKLALFGIPTISADASSPEDVDAAVGRLASASAGGPRGLIVRGRREAAHALAFEPDSSALDRACAGDAERASAASEAYRHAAAALGMKKSGYAL